MARYGASSGLIPFLVNSPGKNPQAPSVAQNIASGAAKQVAAAAETATKSMADAASSMSGGFQGVAVAATKGLSAGIDLCQEAPSYLKKMISAAQPDAVSDPVDDLVKRLQGGIEAAAHSTQSMRALAILMLAAPADARRSAVELAEKAADDERARQAKADEELLREAHVSPRALVAAATTHCHPLPLTASDCQRLRALR